MFMLIRTILRILFWPVFTPFSLLVLLGMSVLDVAFTKSWEKYKEDQKLQWTIWWELVTLR